MNILALDTTMQACSVAVLNGTDKSRDLFRLYEERARGHAEALMPMIEKVMDQAGLSFDDLDRIAVTVGPGTFTGVRVGVAAARGLALATGAGLVGVTSLAVIARAAMNESKDVPHGGVIASAADARRGQVYFAMFDAQGRALCDHMALTPEEAAGLLPVSPGAVLAGSAADLIADAANALGRPPQCIFEGLQPDAAVLAIMAAERDDVEPEPVSPLYLRAPDAKPQTGKAVPHM